MNTFEKCTLSAWRPSPFEELRGARIPLEPPWAQTEEKRTADILPRTLYEEAAGCPFPAAARHSHRHPGSGLPPPPTAHAQQPLTSREPSFMVEPGTVRGMVRLRSPGSGTWRALGVGGGGWKVIP